MPSQKDIPEEHHVHRVGGWLPTDHRIQRQWFSDVISHVDQNPQDYHPVIQEFKELIEGSTRLYMLFNSMFEELPSKKPYTTDPAGHKQVRDYEHMLQLLNHLIRVPPSWSEKEHGVGLVGLPVMALYDWPMATPAGFAVFLDAEVNAMLKKVLNVWGEYLQSPDSARCLNSGPNGWFGETGSRDLTQVANEASDSDLKFEDLFICDPSATHYGFKSWDDFFVRRFREEARPVAAPENDDVIANCCESTPYKLARNVKARDHFWVKGQPYSVKDMLHQDPLSEQFVGGDGVSSFLVRVELSSVA